MSRKFTVSDGKLVLYLYPDETSGYTVTSPLHPEMVTEAETVEEAFEMARDAIKTLKESHAKLVRERRREISPAAMRRLTVAHK